MPELIVNTARGLYCEAGGFHIDPWLPVPRAVVTHAHTDHACPGSERYLVTPTGKVVLAARYGNAERIDALAYGVRERIGDVLVSLHPAGHVLGSAQVRIEHARTGETWVISGDYKTQPDGLSEPFEAVRCHTFVTESTFGLPVYRWLPNAEVFGEINAWWRANADAGTLSLIACYALGKAQRLLAGLDASIGPVLIHGALKSCTEAYRACGAALVPALAATQEHARASKGRAIVLAPPSAVRSAWAFKLAAPGGESRIGMASGWMSIRGARRRLYDAGFSLSDHADWPGLLNAIEATGARRVGVTHGSVATMCRYLTECKGLETFAIDTRFTGEAAEEAADPAEPTDAASASATANEADSERGGGA